MIDETMWEKILLAAPRLERPVRLVVFTNAGSTSQEKVVRLAHAVKEHMGKIALEQYDPVMDRDKTEEYRIARVPALVVQSGGGQTITFYGRPTEALVHLLIGTIHALSDPRQWVADETQLLLKRLSHEVFVRVLIDQASPRSKTTAETAIALALESTQVTTEIIVARDFPELMQKYRITTTPLTIIGANIEREGELGLTEFIELLFQAEGLKPGPDKRCLVCGGPSADVMCLACKNRIRAEALDHKRKIEKQKQPDTK